MLVRSSIQTSRRPVAAPVYVVSSGRAPRTVAIGPSTEDHLGETDLLGGLGQPIAAVGATLARDDLGASQLEQDVLEELERDVLGLRDALALRRPLPRGGKLERSAQRVVDLRRDPHARIV